jgi:non-specific serine/threonine protein kinase
VAAGESPPFGDLLRRHRDVAGLTQEELAERAGLSTDVISLLERKPGQRPRAYTVRRLAEALGLSPADLAELQAALHGSATAAGTGSPSAPLTPDHNLPLQLTSFIGREEDVAQVKRLFATSRLLTLTGAGGVGKTRLALEVAAGVRAGYTHGAWLVEPAPLADPTLVVQTVASALDVTEVPGRTIADRLTDFLETRSLLLVLDNCEHLIAAIAQLAEKLLRTSPSLRILATSREPLNLGGETAWRVPSLALPAFQPAPDLGVLSQYAAVRLFIERATAALPSFTVTNQSAPAVAEICSRLDGIPLAIELAAARVKVFSLEQIRRRLGDRLQWSTGGSRTALPRQQTLRATVDWSYDLLSANEQALLRRLSAFAGDWSLEATEAIGSGGAIERHEVVDLLASLVDKSLVQVIASGDKARNRMLETIRQYADEMLGLSAELEQVHDRHLDFYLALAEEAAPQLKRREQLEWLARLEAEHDNLRAALGWALRAEGDGEPALRLAGALGHYWHRHNDLTEGQQWTESALASGGTPASGPAAVARARVLAAAGALAWVTGDFAKTESLCREAVAFGRAVGALEPVRHALLILGNFAVRRGDLAAAQALLDDSLGLAYEPGDDSGSAGLLYAVSRLAQILGQSALCQATARAAVARARASGDRFALGGAFFGLGGLALERGAITEARASFEESLRNMAELGDHFSAGWPRLGTAQAELEAGNLAGALAHSEESVAVYREFHSQSFLPIALLSLGIATLRRGDLDRAAAVLNECLDKTQLFHSRPLVFGCCAGLAAVAMGRGDLERAGRLGGAAEALRDELGFVVWWAYPHECARLLSAVHDAVDAGSFSACWAVGRAIPLEQSVAYALVDSALRSVPD